MEVEVVVVVVAWTDLVVELVEEVAVVGAVAECHQPAFSANATNKRM
jgi:hypothetical protein